MFDAHTLFAFLVAAVVIALTPGPDSVLVLSRSLTGGRHTGLVTALGSALGLGVHTLLAALGLSAVLMTSALAFEIVKFAGVAYLIYLGVRALLDRAAPVLPSRVTPVSSARALWQAALTDVLNPKAALFFVAFLPQFVEPARRPVVAQFLVLGVTLLLVCLAWFCTVAILAGAVSGALRRHPSFARWQQRVMGGVYVALGVRLAFVRRD